MASGRPSRPPQGYLVRRVELRHVDLLGPHISGLKLRVWCALLVPLCHSILLETWHMAAVLPIFKPLGDCVFRPDISQSTTSLWGKAITAFMMQKSAQSNV